MKKARHEVQVPGESSFAMSPFEIVRNLVEPFVIGANGLIERSTKCAIRCTGLHPLVRSGFER